ncbi:MAG: sporulation transcriptional regulator SpoIIID [Eubacterium sp.]|nr:sporulation transcriptional regulator SpoIIID [Eubacterium sp.]
MKEYIEKRVMENAKYIVNNHATVRECAKKMGKSKSTVHKDVSDRIWEIDRELAKKVRKILNINKAERHIRGGLATKKNKEEQKKSLAKLARHCNRGT